MFCFSQKTTNVNKTHQLIAGIGTDILGVMEPHLKGVLEEEWGQNLLTVFNDEFL